MSDIKPSRSPLGASRNWGHRLNSSAGEPPRAGPCRTDVEVRKGHYWRDCRCRCQGPQLVRARRRACWTRRVPQDPLVRVPPPCVLPWRYLYMPRPEGRFSGGPHLSRPRLAYRLFFPTSAARPCLGHLYPLDPASPSAPFVMAEALRAKQWPKAYTYVLVV